MFIYKTHFNGGRPFLLHIESPFANAVQPLCIEATRLVAFPLCNGKYSDKPCFEIRGDVAHTFTVWTGEDYENHTSVGHEFLVAVHADNEVCVNGQKLEYNAAYSSYGITHFTIANTITRFCLNSIGVIKFITKRGQNDVPYSWIHTENITYLICHNVIISNNLLDSRFDPYSQYYGQCKFFNPMDERELSNDIHTLTSFERILHKMIIDEIKKTPTVYDVLV
jgi:hypothetical protein